MNSKKKVLISAIATIALCLSLIVGSPFALFTDTKSTNITITSGDVEVAATLSLDAHWSAKAKADQKEAQDDLFLIDENGHKYDHVNTGNKFTNGGYAQLVDDYKIAITNITPGDKIDATLYVQNTGNVSMIYRYEIKANDGKLAEGMVVTANDTPYESAKVYTSKWSDVVEAGAATIEHKLSFELPVYAGDEYQTEVDDNDTKDVEYTITVYAVQGNALMDEAISEYDKIVNVANRDELQLALQTIGNAYTIQLTDDIVGNVEVPQHPDVKYTIDGNGHTFNGAIVVNGASAGRENSALTIQDVNFVADSKAALGRDAFINFGDGSNNYRYVSNITVENCTFTETLGGKSIAAIKTYTGGDKNVKFDGCTVNAGMHSFFQGYNVSESFVITDCEVYSKNGINLNNNGILEMSGCTFEVEGYAVRFGANGTINDTKYTFNISNSTLKTSNAEGSDTVIIFRNTAKYCVLNLVDCVLENANGEIYSGNIAGTTVINEIANP